MNLGRGYGCQLMRYGWRARKRSGAKLRWFSGLFALCAASLVLAWLSGCERQVTEADERAEATPFYFDSTGLDMEGFTVVSTPYVSATGDTVLVYRIVADSTEAN